MDENENNNQQPAASAAPVSNAPVSKNVSLETFYKSFLLSLKIFLLFLSFLN